MRTILSRTIATAAAAAIVLTTFSLQPASAGSRHGDAAALGAFAAVFGTIAAIIAAEQYRDQPTYAPPYGPGYGPTYGYGPVYPGGVPHGPWRHHHHW
jgi:hypothetical protein